MRNQHLLATLGEMFYDLPLRPQSALLYLAVCLLRPLCLRHLVVPPVQSDRRACSRLGPDNLLLSLQTS